MRDVARYVRRDEMDHWTQPSLKPASVNDAWIRALQRTQYLSDNSHRTLAVALDEIALTDGQNVAFVGESEELTYLHFAVRAKHYSNWAIDQNLTKGDVVALLLENQPDYAAIWIGLSRLGIIVALINPQLKSNSLHHCIKAAAPLHLIAGKETLEELTPDASGCRYWVHGANCVVYERVDISAPTSIRELPASHVALKDRALLIYTSGTTGLPKAAFVSHWRIMMWSEWFAGILDAQKSDRLYNCLPMYHSIGGVVAVGSMLVAASTVIIRRKFSASSFWADIVETRATIFQYIGDLCHYLTLAPPDPHSKHHSLRLCIGNGLREATWIDFATRFSIPRIIEFYAATEGSFSLFNVEGRPGAIGRIPRFLLHRSPVALVRHDYQTQLPARDMSGRCVRCDPGEVGEAIGVIADAETTFSARYEGYTDAVASLEKILRDVFREGDRWFRTGDLMRQDEDGFFYFVDRIGDTFRWKGENVSTLEVSDAIAKCQGVLEVVVYGVTVPSREGRAGMAAIVASDAFELDTLYAHLQSQLPRFARPLFIRLQNAIAHTGTFKQVKQKLVAEGFDPALAEDPIYLDSLHKEAYLRVDARVFSLIADGSLRL